MIAAGKDPSREKQREKLRSKELAGDTFTLIAAEYCNKRKRDGNKPWAPATANRSAYRLSLLSGSIGRMPIGELGPLDVLTRVRTRERKGNQNGSARMRTQT